MPVATESMRAIARVPIMLEAPAKILIEIKVLSPNISYPHRLEYPGRDLSILGLFTITMVLINSLDNSIEYNSNDPDDGLRGLTCHWRLQADGCSACRASCPFT